MPDLPDGAVVLSSMDGNPETDTICFSKSRRLPVCRADYEIETEVFSQLGDIMRVSKRTNEEIPEYLSKAFYNPTGGFSGPLSSVAMRRAEQLCEHQYPHAHRDLIKVFREAEWAFKLWWDHLEDDTFVEVDDNAAKEIYTKEFADGYRSQLYRLDDAHSENQERYCNYKDRNAEYERTHGYPATGGVHYPHIEYYLVSPKWKQLIAADGRKGGLEAADEDRKVGVGFRDGAELEKLARERFETVWKGITLEVHFRDTYMFDFLGLRSIYVQNFMRTYTEQTASGQGPVPSQETGARIVTSHLDGDARVYVIEINDPQHWAAPVRVEVAVRAEDDVQMRGETNNAG